MPSRRLRAGAAVAALAGALLFAWAIRQAGTAEVFEGVRRIGAGLVVICLLGGVRGFIRAVAWRFCVDAPQRPSIASMYAAYLAGDALGNITPFGFLISEPSKVVLVRGRVDVPTSAAALTIENLFYSATVLVMLASGTAALLLRFAVPQGMRVASIATLAVAVLLAIAVMWVVTGRRRVVSGSVEWLIARGLAPRRLAERLPSIRLAGDRIFGFVARRRRAVLSLAGLEASYHVLAVAEIWFAVALITGRAPDLLTAFVLEYVNRAITVGLQFVPMWLGVDEAGTSLATTVLQLGPATGVSLALARKVRNIVWTLVGTALLLRHGLGISATARESAD